MLGGTGDDVLCGGDGDDVFALAVGEDRDRILGFETGADLFRLADGLSYDDLTSCGEKIEAGDDIVIVIVGVDSSDLTELDLIVP